MNTAKRENHKRWRTPEYMCWASMKDRCLNKNSRPYAYYGARGIIVCDAWIKSFMAFYRDMGPRPGPRFTLERRDNERGYDPSNCYWAPWSKQARNRRGNIAIEHGGETKVATDWALQFGIPKSTFLDRIAKGWSFERATMKEQTTCERGHPWSGLHKRGGHFCRICQRIRDARRRPRRKAAQVDFIEMLQEPTNE